MMKKIWWFYASQYIIKLYTIRAFDGSHEACKEIFFNFQYITYKPCRQCFFFLSCLSTSDVNVFTEDLQPAVIKHSFVCFYRRRVFAANFVITTGFLLAMYKLLVAGGMSHVSDERTIAA